jgi:curved DNA-binding protein CbpA
MLEFQEDFYEILGVQETSTPEEIRKAYLKLAKKLHPDRFPNDEEKRAEAQAEFSKVTRAHDVLSDPKQRDEYDALRGLAKKKLAAESGEPAAAAAAGGAATAPEQKGESREAWAAKHRTRAVEMLARKRFPEAETAIKEAIRLCPTNASYHAVLAEIQLARGWKTLALTSAQAALKLDPKSNEAKAIELKIKAASGKTTGTQTKPTVTPPGSKPSEAPAAKKGILDQLKDLLNKKM